MTNREWLLNKMQSMSDEEFAEAITVPDELTEEFGCGGRRCVGRECPKCKYDWIQQEHQEKPTLSEAERVILENINKDYKWIAKDRAGNMLFIYQRKPYKNDSGNWLNGGTNHGLELFKHLFQFITWQDEEPYNIEELLKGE